MLKNWNDLRVSSPGGGYQDKETSRETDKTIRLRLTSELEQLKRELEGDKRRLMQRKGSFSKKYIKLPNSWQY